jgi:hypothetical protein
VTENTDAPDSAKSPLSQRKLPHLRDFYENIPPALLGVLLVSLLVSALNSYAFIVPKSHPIEWLIGQL